MTTAPPPPLSALPDADADHAAALVAAVAEGVPPVLRADAIAARGWVAAACEDALVGEAALRVAQAAASHGWTQALSREVPWRPRADVAAFRLPLTAAALQALAQSAHPGSGYVLVERGGGFALAADGDLYWMLAGPRPLLEAALGTTVEAQHARFASVVAAYAAAPGAQAAAVLARVAAAAIG